jgi:hypothetical protein
MATRSAIGYALPSGKVRAVYCHWDGSPSHQLPILEEGYSSLPKVRALIKPGSMSSLRTSETWASEPQRDADGKADFDLPYTNLRDPQPLYHHERGAGPWCAGDGSDYGDPPSTVDDANAPAHWRDCGCEWLYVFRPSYGWFHYEL